MAKTANVFTRVDPELKEQAEIILNRLGISMSTAMGIYLQQIVLQKGLPFEVKLPKSQMTDYGSLSDDEFNHLMDQAAKSYASGAYKEFGEFEKELRQDLDI